MELDELVMTDLSYAERLQAKDPDSPLFADNQFVAGIVSNVRYIYKNLNATKIKDTYDRIQSLREDIDIEKRGDGIMHDSKTLDSILKHINNYFTKINPKNKRNFRKLVKEMCQQILNDQEKVHKKITGKLDINE